MLMAITTTVLTLASLLLFLASFLMSGAFAGRVPGGSQAVGLQWFATAGDDDGRGALRLRRQDMGKDGQRQQREAGTERLLQGEPPAARPVRTSIDRRRQGGTTTAGR